MESTNNSISWEHQPLLNSKIPLILDQYTEIPKQIQNGPGPLISLKKNESQQDAPSNSTNEIYYNPD